MNAAAIAAIRSDVDRARRANRNAVDYLRRANGEPLAVRSTWEDEALAACERRDAAMYSARVRHAAENGLALDETGPDWSPTIDNRYFVQSESNEKLYAFGRTPAAAMRAFRKLAGGAK